MARLIGAVVVATSTTMMILTVLCVSISAETHTDCGVAQTAFSFCIAYVAGLDRGALPPPKCCMGVRAMQELVPSSLGQRSMCTCLKEELAAAGAVNGARAVNLSRKCGASTNFMPTSLDFDCNGIS